MRSILLDTGLGHAIRILGGPKGRRWVAYPEELEDFTPDNQGELKPANPAGDDDEAVQLVEWLSNDDISNPQNWSRARKAFVTSLICLLNFAVYVGSAIVTSAFYSLQDDFGVNEHTVAMSLSMYVIGYGVGALVFSPLSEIPQCFAGLVVLRFVTGFLGAPVLATGGASIADMYGPAELPVMLALWVVPAFSAPGFGPVFGNAAAQALGWRWTMWEIVSFTTIVIVCFLPETHHSTILHYRARRLRSLTSSRAYQTKHQVRHAHHTTGEVLRDALIKPFQITILDPSIAYANLYISLLYGFYYLFFCLYPLLFLPIALGGVGVYDLGFLGEGIAYLSIVVRSLVGFVIYVVYQVFIMWPSYHKTGWPVNEVRLLPALWSSAGASIGLWMVAATGGHGAHWSGSLVGTAVFVASNFITFQCIFYYISLSYPTYCASILAANDFLRSVVGAGMIHAGPLLFKSLTLTGGVAFLAAASLAGVPGLGLIYWYGSRLRANSRFADTD